MVEGEASEEEVLFEEGVLLIVSSRTKIKKKRSIVKL
jgi:hypothetical protein